MLLLNAQRSTLSGNVHCSTAMINSQLFILAVAVALTVFTVLTVIVITLTLSLLLHDKFRTEAFPFSGSEVNYI